MALQTFIICSSKDSQELQEKIVEVFGDDGNSYVVREKSQWLVAAEMTTRQVYEKIEIDEGKSLHVVVFLAATYWGRHKTDMWEWLELD